MQAHLATINQLRAVNPRYDIWLDLYSLLVWHSGKPLAQRPPQYSPQSTVGAALDHMIKLAGQDSREWMLLLLAVHYELVDRKLIDEEGRTCP